MDIVALLYVLFVLTNIQYPQKGNCFFDDALKKERTDTIKCFIALFVILVHTTLTVDSGIALHCFKSFSYISITVFFALSGYGLVLSYKSGTYQLKNYWKKRFYTVLMPYLFFIVIYIIVRASLGEVITIQRVVKSFIDGSPIVQYSWFVEAIILYYAAFYFTARYAKNDMSLFCFLMVAFTIAYCIVMKKLHFNSYWYNTSVGFPVGMIWAHKRNEIAEALKRKSIVYASTLGIVFLLVLYCTRVLWMWEDLGEIFVALIFCVLVFALQYLVPAKSNAVTKFIGDISFEMYMSHGAFIMLLWPIQFFKDNPLLFGLAVFAGSIAMAWIIHTAIDAIKKPFLKK